MREVFLLMKYNLTTLKIYSKQGRKFKFFCQIGLKYRKIVFKYWKYILNTLKSVSKYIWFGKGDQHCRILIVSTKRRKKVTLGSRFYTSTSTSTSIWVVLSLSTLLFKTVNWLVTHHANKTMGEECCIRLSRRLWGGTTYELP